MIVAACVPKPDESPAGTADALVMLMAEHDAIEQVFDRLGDASSHDERAMLAGRICRLLAVHASCEEELLYPAASTILSDDRLVRAAEVEHAAARELMRRVEVLSPAEPQFGPTVQLLREYVTRHAGEEERALFPRLRRSGIDLHLLGVALAARRDELERLSGDPPRQGSGLAGTSGAGVASRLAGHAWSGVAPQPHGLAS